MQPDVGAQEPDATADAYYYIGGRRRPGVVRRLPRRRPCLFDRVAFVLAFLRQTCLTYVCTQILLLPLTLVYSSLCIRALEDPDL